MTAPKPDVLTVVQLLLARYHRDVVQPLLATYADQIRALEAQVALHTRRFERGHLGLYVRGAQYEKGDEVMLYGSTWRAQKDEPAGPPPGDGWVLVAKGKKYAA